MTSIAKLIDHSLLRPELTEAEVREGCALAARYGVASVCVRPADVPLAAGLLRGTGVLVGTVAGFPHGSSATATKAAEAALAVAQGAAEVDMVVNIGWLRSGDLADVEADIRAVVDAAAGATVKVILENAYLTADQIAAGCRAAERAGAHFVKTSTGFAPGGATMDDLALMRATVSPHVGVKAAGGVRTLDTLLAMAAIGVTRFGATATAAILDDAAHREAHGAPAAAGAAPADGGY
ncbi:deoxyribose-phosphate aldolase [Spirilliplanes yamanashiensis]|uniref:Deoxyribose-phosphate aldolase n=1 Tax=Spirilliplanes yamanashiensis TaxID=42233 RepID=A0A8J3YE10_9ACTN|nr:deoxyribose-phosphate aldolase [Spirilliplanes yamanashiensis]MDP9816667.1 deoxyribose-phosphate aldolase [Spirilliplanes yamanashiensis]GIJ06189.1 deoxyribose-phosphate aldolase [Spirilliplanes yamanashiensis]